MFFSWYLENKHFKSGGNLKGQIIPLLLVILVILLIAAVATINIGRVSLDKTCSANGADAGSLAAASGLAGAFNSLALINQSMQENYDMNYYTYGQIYFMTEGYINIAIIESLSASGLAAAGLAVTTTGLRCAEIFWGGLITSILDGLAASLLFDAGVNTSAFNLCMQYMLSLTDSFHESQLQMYCDSIDYMDKSYDSATKVGFNFAFSNSCIPAKLSNTQSDVFNAWLVHDGPVNDKTYSWQDKLPSTGSPGNPAPLNPRSSQEHTVSATLDLPNITSYQLQHTVGTYSEITGLLDGLISRSQIIAGVLNSTAVSLMALAAMWLFEFILGLVAYVLINSGWPPSEAAGWVVCGWAYSFYFFFEMEQDYLVGILVALVAVAGAVSLFLLKADNDKAFDDWAPDGIQSSTSCGDASDLMIVKIDEVILPKWNTTCCTTQQHPGTSSSIIATSYPMVRSCSTSKFDGGDVGSFDDSYDPSIISAN